MNLARLLLLSVPLVACSKKADPPAAQANPPAAPADAPAMIDPAAVNTLVPAALKDKLVFGKCDVTEERAGQRRLYTLSAPKSWTEGEMKMLPKLDPPREDGWGNLTGIHLATNCDGACTAKDWAAISERVDLSQFRTAQYTIDKEATGKTNHLIIAHQDGAVFITYVWWVDGAPNYHRCSATLQTSGLADDSAPDLRTATPAFEAACKAVAVTDL